MTFEDLPGTAAWRHIGARDGFEAVFFRLPRSVGPLGPGADPPGYRLEGHSVAVEDGQAWSVGYTISLDDRWATRTARIWGRSLAGERHIRLDADASGRWELDGSPVSELDGCLDVDLEASACTNTFPVHRLTIPVGQSADAPAAYVHALDLRVERLEQEYLRVEDDGTRQRYDYRSPRFGFECQLVFDPSGLVLDYPGIATRVL